MDALKTVKILYLMSLDDLCKHVMTLAEWHEESETYEEKQRHSSEYDFAVAYGKYTYGRHAFETALDKACSIPAKEA